MSHSCIRSCATPAPLLRKPRGALRAACAAVFVLAIAPTGASAFDIARDPLLYPTSAMISVTQSRAAWNIWRLNAASHGGEGAIAWASLGPTDMPSASKVRTAWLEREIHRIHEALGHKDVIDVRAPDHFDMAEVAGTKALMGHVSIMAADRRSTGPLIVIPYPKTRGRFVILGLFGPDEVVAKAATGFAERWAQKAIAADTEEAR
jgi:hypothetical protein